MKQFFILSVALTSFISCGKLEEEPTTKASDGLENTKAGDIQVISSVLSVEKNDSGKSLLKIQITDLKNLSYEDVEVIVTDRSYKRNPPITRRRMEPNEVIDQNGRVTIDLTSEVNDTNGLSIAFGVGGEGTRVILLRDKRCDCSLDEWSEVEIDLRKGRTYHIKLSAEQKLTGMNLEVRKNGVSAANQVVYIIPKSTDNDARRAYNTTQDFSYRYDKAVFERTFAKYRYTTDANGMVHFIDKKSNIANPEFSLFRETFNYIVLIPDTHKFYEKTFQFTKGFIKEELFTFTTNK